MSLKVLKIDLRMIVHAMDNKAVKIYTKAGNGEPKKRKYSTYMPSQRRQTHKYTKYNEIHFICTFSIE